VSVRLSRPLDPDAITAANEKLWAEHPELKGRALTLGPDDYAYRVAWVNYYIEAGGQAEQPRRGVPPSRPSDPCEVLRHLTFKVKSVQFKSDHALLNDNAADWTKNGVRFESKDKAEWREDHSFPISHTKAEKVSLIVEFEVKPPGATAAKGEVIGTGSPYLSFRGNATFSSGRVFVALTATGALPDDVTKLENENINWQVHCASSSSDAGSTGPHKLYLTMHKPIVESCKRRPIEIVEYLFSKYPGYVLGYDHLPKDKEEYLKNHPDEKAKLDAVGFAAYDLNNTLNRGGAWPLVEFRNYGGECQAIVRLIRGILHQIGCPGKAEAKFANADARDYNKPIIRDTGTRCTGPDASKRYALVDRAVAVGKLYGDEDGVGWNNYEAYMLFTEGGESAWFGGGVGRLPDGTNPLHVFWALAEYESEYVEAEMVFKRKVTRIWEYPH
jgi:hypothetical protein